MTALFPPDGKEVQVILDFLLAIARVDQNPASHQDNIRGHQREAAFFVIKALVHCLVGNEGFHIRGLAIHFPIGVGIAKLVGKNSLKPGAIAGHDGSLTLIVGGSHGSQDTGVHNVRLIRCRDQTNRADNEGRKETT